MMPRPRSGSVLRNPASPPVIPALLLLLAVLVVACATPQALRRADQEAQLGNWDAAIAYYQKALQEDPDNLQARIRLQRAKVKASQLHQRAGKELWEQGELERALLEYELAVRLDPGNELAATELRRLEGELAAQRRAERDRKTPTEEAVERARRAAPPLPRLQPQVTGPISLDFRSVSVQEIYRALGRIGGLNVLFDPTLSDPVTSFQVEEVTFDEALRMLAAAEGHFVKVMSENTLLVVPDNVTKRRQYADQVLRTFFLSNAGAETVAQTLRALLQARSVAENVDLNTVTIRDTPEVVQVAERIVAAADKARGEVLLDVEILEVNRAVLRDYGLSLSSYGIGGSLRQTEAGISLADLKRVTNADLFIAIPSVRYQFLKETNNFKLIAQPQMRISEGQEASLLVGERVPVITTTFNPQQTFGGNVVPVSSTAYEDVGISITAQPRVHHNLEVTLQLQIEISSVIGTSVIQNLPIFSSRNISATIRLRDGETNMLAGLLRDDERTRLQGVPGLLNLPVVGRLFGNTRDEVAQTDVVLAITPHILRAAEISDEDLEAIYVGTEMNIGGGVGVGTGPAPSPRPGRPGTPGAPGEEPREPVVLALLPARHTVATEQEFAVDVTLDGAVEAFSAGLRLRFDPEVVRFVDAFEGGFLQQDGSETAFQASPAGAGDLAVGMSRIGDVGGISGSGVLVTLVFQAVAPGSTSIEFASAAIRGADGRPMPVQMVPAEVEVSG